MTPSNAKLLLPIITAFAEGKTIEIGNRPNLWRALTDPDFGADPKYYRIKPEPKEYAVVVYRDGSMSVPMSLPDATRRAAWMNENGFGGATVKKFREVIEE